MSNINMLSVLPKEAYAHYISGEAVIIDIREQEKKQVQPFIKQLVRLPLSQLENNLQAIPVNKSVYVLSGKGRSAAQAVGMLRQNGVARAKNIYEGMIGWEQYGLPTEAVEKL
jgi:rhodanese-related sulfurtransferase